MVVETSGMTRKAVYTNLSFNPPLAEMVVETSEACGVFGVNPDLSTHP
jgi:hypothetical protein